MKGSENMSEHSHIVSSKDVAPKAISREELRKRISPMIYDILFKDNNKRIISSSLCNVERDN